MRTVLRSLFLVALSVPLGAASLAGCSGATDAGEATTGSASVALTVARDAVARVDVVVQGSGMTSSITATLSPTATGYAGLVPLIPPGTNRTFTATAYGPSGNVAYSGQATGVTIELGKTAAVAVVMQETSPPTQKPNTVPAITAFTESAVNAAPGATVAFGVTATDADGDALTYAWTATDGTFNDASVPNPVWTAGSASATTSQVITVTVSDGAASISASTTIWHAVGFAPPPAGADRGPRS